jgi:hypothetical protein
MTLAARTVLEDCSQAAAQLTDGIQGSEWRIAYMASIALLRADYHVLGKEMWREIQDFARHLRIGRKICLNQSQSQRSIGNF